MAERYKVELGRAIARRRQELGLTQKDLRDRTHHKEPQTVSRWERGETTPADLDAVAAALDWTLGEMVAGIEPPDRATARRWGVAWPADGSSGGDGDLMGALKPANVADVREQLQALDEQLRLLRAETATRDAEAQRQTEARLQTIEDLLRQRPA